LSDIFKLFDGSLSAGGKSAIVEQDASSFSDVSSENSLVSTLASGTDSVDLDVDYSDFANFVQFNSAESYVTVTADQIINSYPSDGTVNDLQQFVNSLDGYQRYFLARWPSFSGHLRLNPAISASYVRIDDFGVDAGTARTSFVSPGTGSISVQGWIDVPVLTGSNDVQVVFQKSAPSGDGLTVFVTGSSLCFRVVSGSNTANVSAALPNGTASFFAAVLDRTGSPTGSMAIYLGTVGTYPSLAATSNSSLGARFDLGSGSFFIGSGSVAGSVVRPFTGSIDSLSVWSTARSKTALSGTYNRKVFAQEGLTALWRFNSAGPQTNVNQARITHDSSGHRLDGRINGFYPALLSSGSYNYDVPDPILTLDDASVVNYVVSARVSGSNYDRNNSNLIFNMFPGAFSGGDQASSDVFKNFALILARHFDRIKLYINQLPNMRRVTHDDFNQAPDELLDEVGKFLGWNLQGSFANADASQYFVGRSVTAGPQGNAGLDKKLSAIKAEFWKRTILNLTYLYKTKGTAESVESLLRVYGADAGFVRLKEYARKTETRLPVNRVVADRSVYALIFGGDPRATSVSSDSPPIVWTASASITLANLTLVSNGNVPVSGTSNSPFGSLSLASLGNVPTTGSLSPTAGLFGALSVASAGKTAVSGTLAATLGTLTISSAGTAPASGTMGQAFSSLTLASIGNAPVSGTSNSPFGALTLASIGNVPTTGSLASGTFGSLAIVSTGGTAHFAQLDSGTLGALTISSAGNAPASGTLTKTFGSLTVSSTGTAPASGTLGSTFGSLTLSSAGNAPASGTLGQTFGSLVVSSSGTAPSGISSISPAPGVLLS